MGPRLYGIRSINVAVSEFIVITHPPAGLDEEILYFIVGELLCLVKLLEKKKLLMTVTIEAFDGKNRLTVLIKI